MITAHATTLVTDDDVQAMLLEDLVTARRQLVRAHIEVLHRDDTANRLVVQAAKDRLDSLLDLYLGLS